MDFVDLEVLRLQGTNITGTLPAELGDLPNLIRLDLSSNELHGTIPQSIASRASLKVLDLGNNGLHGSIPSFQGSSIEVIKLVCSIVSTFLHRCPALNFAVDTPRITTVAITVVSRVIFGASCYLLLDL